MHREISVLIDGRRFVGTTENLSVRGAMMTVPDIDPVLRRGDRVEVSFDLPGLPEPILCSAVVRWVSSVLEDMVGVEFDRQLDADARKILELFGRETPP